jgi:hypothetical protein
MIISAFTFASQTRVNSLGGAGFWADDYANIGDFPASVNNHQVAWTDGNDFTSVWNVDGTTWGFAGGTGDDIANLWWGNGTMGVNVGVGRTPEKKIDDGDAVDADANNAVNIGFGMPFAGMDFGVTYGMGCDECGAGSIGVNVRRAQKIWLFDNMLVNFHTIGEEKTDDVITTSSDLGVSAHLYQNKAYENGINSLFALGFFYGQAGKIEGDTEDPETATGIQWNFAVESPMTDWATIRLGYNHAYDFASGGIPDGGLVVGLGFNYGSFNLDMSLADHNAMLTDPVKYITGYNDSPLGAQWTISYNW